MSSLFLLLLVDDGDVPVWRVLPPRFIRPHPMPRRHVRSHDGTRDGSVHRALQRRLLRLRHGADGSHVQWAVHSRSLGHGWRDDRGVQRPLQYRLLLCCASDVSHGCALPRRHVRGDDGTRDGSVHRAL